MSEPHPPTPEELARYEAIMRQRLNESPFYQLIGMEILELRSGYSRFRLNVTPQLRNVSGIVHGGAIASITDAAMGVALATLLDPLVQRPITVEMKINYMAPSRDGELIAEGRVVQRGSTVTVTEAEVVNGEGTLVALAMGTFLVKQAKQSAEPEQQTGD